MKIEIQRINQDYHLEASNEIGNKLYMDGSVEIGGGNLAFRPMQMLLAAIGGCSSIDVISILKKQKQEVTDYHVTVDGEREKGKEPSLFTDIHLHFALKGNHLDQDKVKKAIELSLEKYCSVAKTLEKTAKITYSFSVE
ncbi:MAG: OsmC family protein [Thermoflexibacter sp.]|jgi:putative redox protein|nr:OsmC family protein [Thermoflexibacter sp.]